MVIMDDASFHKGDDMRKALKKQAIPSFIYRLTPLISTQLRKNGHKQKKSDGKQNAVYEMYSNLRHYNNFILPQL